MLGITYIAGSGKSVTYTHYSVGLRLDQPVLQVFSIRSLVAIGVFVVAGLVLRYLRVGRDIRAIGGDRRASRIAGAPVDRLLVGVFIASALGAALPGALLSYSLAYASPTNIGFDVLTFSATAALIGGVSLSGGRGSPAGIAAGVLALSVLQEILSILQSPDYVQSLITGGLLLVVTILWAPHLTRWLGTSSARAPGQPRRRPLRRSDRREPRGGDADRLLALVHQHVAPSRLRRDGAERAAAAERVEAPVAGRVDASTIRRRMPSGFWVG